MTLLNLTSQHLRGVAASTFIGAIFALIWGINGSLALSDSWRVGSAAIVIVITLGLVAVSINFYRSAGRVPSGANAQTTNPFRTTAYRASVAAMLIALPVASRVLTLNGHEDIIMPAVAIIVGLHFFGLVPAFRNGVFAWIAGGFCLIGLFALFLPVQAGETLELRYAVVGLGCALVLWLGELPIIVKTFRQLGAAKQKFS